jgi:serine/threonine protein kinase
MRSKDEEKLLQFKIEYSILNELDSEYIIKVRQIFYSCDNYKMYLVMDYDEELQSLSSLLSSLGSLKEEVAKKIFVRLISGIIDCHRKGICHR